MLDLSFLKGCRMEAIERVFSSVHAGVARVSHACLDFLLPPRCVACDSRVVSPDGLCSDCWCDMPFITSPVCERLGLPLSLDLGDGALSARAIAEPPAYDRARAVAIYSGVARQLVTGLKFSRRRELAAPMGRWMAKAGRPFLSPGCVVAPVPLHRYRLLQRRFNQSADLGRVVAAVTGLEWDPLLLQRTRMTRQQVGLDSNARHKNVRGAFRVRPGHETHVAGRHVILVDDVLTTGSTVTACTRVLRKAGAENVTVLCFAMATGDEDHAGLGV